MADTARARHGATEKAIRLIDDGSGLEDVRAALTVGPAPQLNPIDVAAKTQTPSERRSRFKSRRRSAALAVAAPAILSAQADADPSEAEIVTLAPKQSSTAVAFANDEDSSNDLRRALYAGIAAIAVVGITGFGVSKLWTASADVPTKTIAVSAAAPEVTVDLEALKAPVETKEVKFAKPMSRIPAAQLADKIAPIEMPVPVIKMLGLIEVGEAASLAQAAETEKKALRAKAVIETKPAEAVKVAAVKPRARPRPVQKSVKAKTKPVSPSAKSDTQSAADTIALRQVTKTVQSDLLELGFYAGAIDGRAGDLTDSAIIEFKTLFGLPVDNTVSGAFLNELKTATASVRAAKVQAAIIESAPVVEAMLPKPVYEALSVKPRSVIAAPVVIPAPMPPVKVVSIAPIAPMSSQVMADTIVEPKRLNNISGTYPSKAIRRNFFETVSVSVSYDVSETGEVVNAKVVALEPAPRRFSADFEKAGLKSVQSQKFSPKTINGSAVASSGHTGRITFKTE